MENISAFFILTICILSVSGDTSSDDGRSYMNVFQRRLLILMKKLSNAQEHISRSVDNDNIFRSMHDRIDNLEKENKKLKYGLEIIMNKTVLERKRMEKNIETLSDLQTFTNDLILATIANFSTTEGLVKENTEKVILLGDDMSRRLMNLEETTKRYERFVNNSFVKLELDIDELNGSFVKLSDSLYPSHHRDCEGISKTLPGSQDGVYRIFPDGVKGVNVYCDMKNGGWTVFQRRQNGNTDFFRGWQEYKNGFGNHSDEYWLGNSFIHSLTINRNCTLRIDLTNWDNISRNATYADFRIENEADNYRLRIGSYSGNAGRSRLSYHNNQEFTTKDRDNDNASSVNCAVEYTGAWWYRSCHQSNLNGDYSVRNNDKGVYWLSYLSNPSSDYMKTTTMKVKCT